tara:strand:+ start:1680 stop:1916 length:237 start_codon:yes stop_codon:yes gene_type:complete
MATFKSQLQALKLGEIATKSKFFQDVSLKELSALKNKQNCNITGSINNAGLIGKVETRVDYTIMKSGVVIFTHVLRIK